MWNGKKTIVVVTLLGMALGQLCWARVPVRTARAGRTRDNNNHPTATELLDKYAQTQDKPKSVIIKSEISEQGHYPRVGRVGQFAFSELRLDGDRSCLRIRKHVNPRGLPIGEAYCWVRLWDGHTYFGLDPSDLRIRTGEEGRDFALDTVGGPGNRGHEVMGYFYGDVRPEERVDRLLRQARSIRVRDRLERLGRSRCYVIEALIERGRYTLWIDPQHGYNIAKAEVFREARQCDAVFPESWKGKMKMACNSLENARFKKIEDVWVLMEVDCKTDSESIYGKGWNKLHYKRTEVILNPDHEALRSFSFDEVPSWHAVNIEFCSEPPERDGGPDLDFTESFEYRWVPKAKFVVNHSCRVVRNDPKHPLPVVKVLPKFGDLVRDYKLDPAPSGAKGKHIVLCFWDINQQPSCELLQSLRDRQEALAEKGVAIIALEASGAQTDRVQSWASENRLQLPVGTFYGRFERFLSDRINDLDPGEKMDMDDHKKKTILSNLVTDLRTIWTIDKLPWLILTDRERVVISEAFGLDELDGILTHEVLSEEPTSKLPSLSAPSKGTTMPSKLLSDGLQKDLILYYSFDDDEGSKVTDLSGNGNHGRVYGAKRTRDAKGGGAIDFDGAHGYIGAEDITLKEYSFSAWLRISKAGANNRYIFILDDWVHYHGIQGNSWGAVSIVADSEEINETDHPFAANTWEHVVLTHQKGTFKLYKDGKLIKTGNLQSGPVTDTLYLGGKEKDPGHSWPGTIDEVALFNRVLTKQEVKLLYKNTRENR
ncbi:MAG: LamG-like jellyroll fold domain-containing protein [Planctomycetota bacterium]